MIAQSCVKCSKKVEWVVLGINFSLFLLKGWFGLLSHSKALLADSFESLVNFIITIVVLACLRLASNDADEKFPYGYGKVEFLASGIVNMLLMIVAIVYVFVSCSEMVLIGPERPPGLIAIVAAAVSIVINYIAFGYGRCAGEKLGSSAISANAQINLTDLVTSAAVIVAVVGSRLGIPRLDHITAIVICVFIIKVTLDGVKKAIRGLMDTSLHAEEVHIRDLIEDIEGIERVGDIRARLVGRNLSVDVNIFFPSNRVLSEGMETISHIKNIIHKKIKNISDVSVQMLALPVTDEPMHKTDYQSESRKSN